jgi:hypothetical protein
LSGINSKVDSFKTNKLKSFIHIKNIVAKEINIYSIEKIWFVEKT